MNSPEGKTLRVGVVGPLPPPAGGMATQTLQLVSLLSEEQLDVSLVQTNRPYRPQMVEKLRGIRALFRLAPYLLSIWKMLGRVDVVHLMANSGWSWQLFSAPVIWLGYLRKIPVIVNYRGGEAQDYFEKSFSRVRPTLERASRVIVPSGYLEKVFAGFGVETTVIPNIINLERFSPIKARDVFDSEQRYRLIITRNLEPIYGIRTAIEAVALVRQQVPAIQLSIAGSGPQKAELEQLVSKLKLEDCVEFVGRLDAEKIVDFYHTADVMVNPTTVDNMPNSVLESLACGVPVVTTNVGGIPYIVEHGRTALMVPSGDSTAMAQEIVRLYQEEALRGTLINNGLKAVRPYAWPEVKGQWLAMYDLVRSGV